MMDEVYVAPRTSDIIQNWLSNVVVYTNKFSVGVKFPAVIAVWETQSDL